MFQRYHVVGIVCEQCLVFFGIPGHAQWGCIAIRIGCRVDQLGSQVEQCVVG